MLLHLPPELIEEILSNLEGKDLARCCMVCKYLNAIANGNSLWIPFCEKYTTFNKPLHEREYKNIYCTLLQYYGFLLNPFTSVSSDAEHILWISSAGQDLRGCCIQWIWSHENRTLEGYKIADQSSPSLLFSIYPADPIFNTSSKICKPAIIPSEEGIKLLRQHQQHTDEFKSLEIHNTIPDGIKIGPQLQRENTIVLADNLRMHPVVIKRPGCRKYFLEGLWFGMYSSHGIEILHFHITTQEELNRSTNDNVLTDNVALATYATMPTVSHFNKDINFESLMEPGVRLVGHKLTGDFNIPADTDSFVVFLDQILPFGNHKYPANTFLDVFPDVRVSDPVDIDKLHIRHLHQGYGRIALHNMRNATWMPILFVAFENENICAVIWLQLGHHALFFNRLVLETIE